MTHSREEMKKNEEKKKRKWGHTFTIHSGIRVKAFNFFPRLLFFFFSRFIHNWKTILKREMGIRQRVDMAFLCFYGEENESYLVASASFLVVLTMRQQAMQEWAGGCPFYTL